MSNDSGGDNNPMAAVMWLILILGACAVVGVLAAGAGMALGQ